VRPRTAQAQPIERPGVERAPAPVDAAAFAQLFASEAPRVWRLLRRLGVLEADLEDLCQEVFLVVYQRWHEFRGDAAASTWVYGIALRKGVGHRRLKRVHAARTSLPEHAAPAVPAEQARALEDADRRRILQAALDKLGEPQRDVFVLYELEELPMREVAALLDVPLHTAYGRLYAAREELAAELRRLSLKGGWP
jgi:RNA polymerase sigma-70 factor (ECF subfamily)